MSKAELPRRPDEHGVPDPFPYMHPTLRENYGNWDWHDRPRPGVLHHMAKSGDEIWTVRAGTQRQMDVYTIRTLCDLADEFADGHMRFTTRSNAEFMVTAEEKTTPLIEKLTAAGFCSAGKRNSISRRQSERVASNGASGQVRTAYWRSSSSTAGENSA